MPLARGGLNGHNGQHTLHESQAQRLLGWSPEQTQPQRLAVPKNLKAVTSCARMRPET